MTTTPVLIHGFTGSGEAWGQSLIDGLAGAGIAPARIDLPGHGRLRGEIDPAAYSIEAAWADIERASDPPLSLVGYSMGGRVALHYAARYPERVTRLVLESTSPGLASEEERALRRGDDAALADQILSRGVEAFVDEWEVLPLFASQTRLSEQQRTRVRTGRLANDAGSLAASLRGLGTGSLPSLWDQLPDIRVPTLLVVGALDSKFVEIGERMASVMPDARLVVVPDAGHCVHLERSAAWLDAVTSFLVGAESLRVQP